MTTQNKMGIAAFVGVGVSFLSYYIKKDKKKMGAVKDTPQRTGHTPYQGSCCASKGHLGCSGSQNQTEQVTQKHRHPGC